MSTKKQTKRGRQVEFQQEYEPKIEKAIRITKIRKHATAVKFLFEYGLEAYERDHKLKLSRTTT